MPAVGAQGLEKGKVDLIGHGNVDGGLDDVAAEADHAVGGAGDAAGKPVRDRIEAHAQPTVLAASTLTQHAGKCDSFVFRDRISYHKTSVGIAVPPQSM